MVGRLVYIVVLLLLIVAQAASAQYNCSIHWSNGAFKAIFETFPDASNGLDTMDDAWYWVNPDDASQCINLDIYKTSGQDGWDADSGFCVRDARSPLQEGETAVIRDICLWAGTAVSPCDLHLSVDESVTSLPPGLTCRLVLTSIPSTVTYNGQREWGPHDTVTLPFYSTDDGTTGYRFTAIVSTVPETSSLLSLACGFLALCGTAIPRCKSRL